MFALRLATDQNVCATRTCGGTGSTELDAVASIASVSEALLNVAVGET